MNANEIKLSAVIITYNEEKNIERCIRSLLPVVDEVIVWDSFSSDSTKEICLSVGAKVFQETWSGFSESKNKANAKASGQYILSVDADEELSPELQSSILKIKSEINKDAYALNRLTNYCGKWIRHSGWYPEYKIRLFKSDLAVWQGDIHEELKFNYKPTIAKLQGDLLHYSYPTVEHYLQKIIQYNRIVAQKNFKRNSNPSLIYHGVVKPAFHFVKKYFFKLGFLDGYEGFVIAKMSAFGKFLNYITLKELTRK